MSFTIHPDLSVFIHRLPKTETHLHIEGALPWELLHALDSKRFSAPPASWEDDFRFTSFAHFEEELLRMALPFFTSVERYAQAAGVVLRRLFEEENVRYLETSFASGAIEFSKLDGQAVARAIKAAAPEGMEVRVFMGIHHNGYHGGSRSFIEASLEWPELDGIDLHGPETIPLEPWTADFWSRARAAGKMTKAHAGEFDGPDFVERVLGELGVKRIQHGVRAAESPALLERMASEGVVCDVCPISNVKLGVVPGFGAHPLPAMLQAGVRCTVSTDDPLSFGNRLHEEYLMLARIHGFTVSDLAGLAANGFEVALLDEAVKGKFLSEIEHLKTEFSP